GPEWPLSLRTQEVLQGQAESPGATCVVDILGRRGRGRPRQPTPRHDNRALRQLRLKSSRGRRGTSKLFNWLNSPVSRLQSVHAVGVVNSGSRRSHSNRILRRTAFQFSCTAV